MQRMSKNRSVLGQYHDKLVNNLPHADCALRLVSMYSLTCTGIPLIVQDFLWRNAQFWKKLWNKLMKPMVYTIYSELCKCHNVSYMWCYTLCESMYMSLSMSVTEWLLCCDCKIQSLEIVKQFPQGLSHSPGTLSTFYVTLSHSLSLSQCNFFNRL